MSHSVLASQKMLVKIVGFNKENVTTRTPEAFEKAIYIICMNDMDVKSQ